MTAAVEVFEDRESWLQTRSQGIGASDAAIILGLSRWKSPLSLYYEKRGLREPSLGEKEYTAWGLALEPAIIEGYRRTTGRPVGWPGALLDGLAAAPPSRYTIARDPDLGYLVASLDAAVLPISDEDVSGLVDPPPILDTPGVLEVKNVDISKGRIWDDAQEPPIEYTVQVQHQMMVTGAKWGSIAALVGGNRFLWADIARDDELIAMIRKLEVEFWERVLTENPPPVDGSDSTKDLLARLYPRDTGEVITLPPEALEWALARTTAMADEKAAKAQRQEAENKLRAAIGDATAGVITGGPTFTLKHQVRKAHTVRESEFRVLRQHGE